MFGGVGFGCLSSCWGSCCADLGVWLVVSSLFSLCKVLFFVVPAWCLLFAVRLVCVICSVGPVAFFAAVPMIFFVMSVSMPVVSFTTMFGHPPWCLWRLCVLNVDVRVCGRLLFVLGLVLLGWGLFLVRCDVCSVWILMLMDGRVMDWFAGWCCGFFGLFLVCICVWIGRVLGSSVFCDFRVSVFCFILSVCFCLCWLSLDGLCAGLCGSYFICIDLFVGHWPFGLRLAVVFFLQIGR